jgi:hypothetical protein
MMRSLLIERVWYNGIIGGLIGATYAILLIVCNKAELLIYYQSTIGTQWDHIIIGFNTPVMWSYNHVFLNIFNVFHPITSEIISNQTGISYFTVLPFWFCIWGFLLGMVLTGLYIFCRTLFSNEYQAKTHKKQVHYAHCIYFILLYLSSLYILFAFVRKISNYDSFWRLWPGYRWYLLYGTGGIVLSGISLVILVITKKKNSWGAIGWTSLICQCFLLACTIFIVLPPSKKALCKYNLILLASAILNDKEPLANQWCDQLMQTLEGKMGLLDSISLFVCPCDKRMLSKEAKCSYVINPDAHSNPDPEVVLLFEADGKWNSAGGKELVCPNRHHSDGCWIVFSNLDIRFVRKDQIDKLKWK